MGAVLLSNLKIFHKRSINIRGSDVCRQEPRTVSVFI